MQAASALTVIGLMSGTSMDGLDMACCRIADDDSLKATLRHFETVAFPEELLQRLQGAGAMMATDLMHLDHDLGRFYAVSVENFCRECGVRPDLIGCHGQTITHAHGKATWQIGEPSFLAVRLSCPVVSDFRRQDIAAGGCGAPLVPATDPYLFAEAGRPCIVLNIGGISNVTWIGTETANTLSGFDTGPGNMVLDALVRHFTGGARSFDQDGALAAMGRIRTDWLDAMNAHPFLQLAPPRSAGAEDFGPAFVETILAELSPQSDDDWHNLLATATEWTAITIAEAIAHHLPSEARQSTMIVCGGGGYNLQLMERLRMHFPGQVMSSEAFDVPMGAREAMAFALLAVMRMRDMPANCPNVTGASHPVLLGKVTAA